MTEGSMTAELVLDARAECAESPVWDAGRQELLWVDIPRHLVHVFDPHTGADRAFDVGRPVGAAARRTSGGMVLATSDGFGLLDEPTGETDLIAPVEQDDPGNLMNDGKCDPAGRFWAGTLTEPPRRGASPVPARDRPLRHDRARGRHHLQRPGLESGAQPDVLRGHGRGRAGRLRLR